MGNYQVKVSAQILFKGVKVHGLVPSLRPKGQTSWISQALSIIPGACDISFVQYCLNIVSDSFSLSLGNSPRMIVRHVEFGMRPVDKTRSELQNRCIEYNRRNALCHRLSPCISCLIRTVENCYIPTRSGPRKILRFYIPLYMLESHWELQLFTTFTTVRIASPSKTQRPTHQLLHYVTLSWLPGSLSQVFPRSS